MIQCENELQSLDLDQKAFTEAFKDQMHHPDSKYKDFSPLNTKSHSQRHFLTYIV